MISSCSPSAPAVPLAPGRLDRQMQGRASEPFFRATSVRAPEAQQLTDGGDASGAHRAVQRRGPAAVCSVDLGSARSRVARSATPAQWDPTSHPPWAEDQTRNAVAWRRAGSGRSGPLPIREGFGRPASRRPAAGQMKAGVPGVEPMRDRFDELVPRRPSPHDVGIIPKKTGHLAFALENSLEDRFHLGSILPWRSRHAKAARPSHPRCSVVARRGEDSPPPSPSSALREEPA